MTFNPRLIICVAVISLNLLQVVSQNGPPSDGGSPSSAMSPKYEILGKYEVAAPDSVITPSSGHGNQMECALFCNEASPECGAFYVKENVCNLVNKDAGGAHSNTTTLTPSTVDYFARKN